MNLAAAVLLWAACSSGQEGAGKDLEELRRLNRPTEVDQAVDKGLKYLLDQQRSDGSFSRQNQTAMTSLAILAFLSAGHVPGEAGEGLAIRRGLEFILGEGRQKEDGYFGESDGSRMYGHGITTLMLAEILGMAADEDEEKRLLLACRRGVNLILRSQKSPKEKNQQGGWRYLPGSADSDLSVTVWQVMALRAARNCGMDISEKPIHDAIDYIRRCFNADKRGFGYQIHNSPLPAMTGAGLLSLHVCGVYKGPEIEASAETLTRRPIGWSDPWFYYGIYYYSQAMHQLGKEQDEMARRIVEEQLLGRQLRDGSWPAPPASSQEDTAGPVYRTALSILALSVEYHYLPIYQR